MQYHLMPTTSKPVRCLIIWQRETRGIILILKQPHADGITLQNDDLAHPNPDRDRKEPNIRTRLIGRVASNFFFASRCPRSPDGHCVVANPSTRHLSCKISGNGGGNHLVRFDALMLSLLHFCPQPRHGWLIFSLAPVLISYLTYVLCLSILIVAPMVSVDEFLFYLFYFILFSCNFPFAR
ncbi:hypothetical protein BDV26DRAFT_31458 [Aspergillus bertholletiae]|uniref:Uncharacterized protein n=1 Tax=Aspergillus bertholletiae TaxID=1226010 RepID=A0A5N7AYE8_9EURO|nr:hypothetical protein BDV26DRAFT_31458 [Aspergillus bertholletiae]